MAHMHEATREHSIVVMVLWCIFGDEFEGRDVFDRQLDKQDTTNPTMAMQEVGVYLLTTLCNHLIEVRRYSSGTTPGRRAAGVVSLNLSAHLHTLTPHGAGVRAGTFRKRTRIGTRVCATGRLPWHPTRRSTAPRR